MSDAALATLRSLLAGYAPGTAVVVPIGSVALGIDGLDDDIDACIVVSDREGTVRARAGPWLDELAAYMRAAAPEHAVSSAFTVLKARVPLLRASIRDKQVDLQLVPVAATLEEWAERSRAPGYDFTAAATDPAAAGLLAVRLPRILLGTACAGAADPASAAARYRSALVCLRDWAKSRRLYGSIDGYPPGVAWAILAARQAAAAPSVGVAGVVLGVLRLIATWAWASEPVRLVPFAAETDVAWSAPVNPALQQPMAVLTPGFEQNTCVAVTETHLSVLIHECQTAVHQATVMDAPPRPGAALRWFSGVFVMTLPEQADENPGWVQALRSKMPFVSQELGAYGLAVRPLGWFAPRRCWVVGFHPRERVNEVMSRRQLTSLCELAHTFLVAQFAQADRVGPFPAWDVFWPSVLWPTWVRGATGLPVPVPASARQAKAQTRRAAPTQAQPIAGLGGANGIAARSIALIAPPPDPGTEVGRMPYSTGV